MIHICGTQLESCVPVPGFGVLTRTCHCTGVAFSEKLGLVATTWSCRDYGLLKTFKVTHDYGLCLHSSFPYTFFQPRHVAFIDNDVQPPYLLAAEVRNGHSGPSVHVINAETGEHVGYVVGGGCLPPKLGAVRTVATKGTMVAIAGWQNYYGDLTYSIGLYQHEVDLVWNLVRIVPGTVFPDQVKYPVHVSWASASDDFVVLESYWGRPFTRFSRFSSGDGSYLGYLPYRDKEIDDGLEGFSHGIAECQDGWLATCTYTKSVLYIAADGKTTRLSSPQLVLPAFLVPITVPPDFLHRHCPVQGFLVLNHGNSDGASLQVFAPRVYIDMARIRHSSRMDDCSGSRRERQTKIS